MSARLATVAALYCVPTIDESVQELKSQTPALHSITFRRAAPKWDNIADVVIALILQPLMMKQ